ncbi:YbjN domain-containing protein [Novosphingobium flavum]|uniref:YbjN domain-containing protein n=1 Tax=Novosphingobium flavum TaxID=1778672 RepID=A0A7X1FTW3_9SPHN|nr:YbjN domain-containing protein [Novosphingobium flavum]MBC2666262.1 YbjN domain-containing protein [Novosphingobium flavum]
MRQGLVVGLVGAAGWGFGSPALAATCPSGLLCAAQPEAIVHSLQVQGYKAVLGKAENSGNPKISTSASGYNYSIFFYGCTKGEDCNSLGFSITFDDDGTNSAELANEWNKAKRFSAMSFDGQDKSLSITYDVTTVGGLTEVNFGDVVDWWQTMLGQARVFFEAHPAPKR